VGISALLNALPRDESEWGRRLVQQANARDLPADVARKAEELAERALAILREGNVRRNRQLSAELNGLYGIYKDQLVACPDMHYLIASDTALGRKSAEVVCDFLREIGLRVDIYVPQGLSMDNPHTFSRGIKSLIHWCEETIPGYHEQGYQVVFNLTGAFKSLQGYLNVVGMFYADEIVYIFETGSQLLSIPRLPLQINVHYVCTFDSGSDSQPCAELASSHA